MIYLIITTSINNKYGIEGQTERQNRYLYAIQETLKLLPSNIIPIIVENNGKRHTYLDNFYYNQERDHVKVIYTDNNKLHYNKGITEFKDIKDVIEHYGIEDDDIIIKLTGRYRVLNSSFFKSIIENQNNYDAFIKFYNVSTLKYENYNCILGLYAIKTKYLKLFNQYTINDSKCAEVSFAKYIKLSGINTKEYDNLNLECIFADNLKKLNV